MNNLQMFNYGGNQVTFRNHEGIAYVNATEMAKSFGKQPSHWLRSQSTVSFIKELSAMRNRIASDLVKVINGDNGGTWMHEDVALEFSRWLSPAFSIWCNDRIKELLNTGMTTTQSIDDLVENPDLIIEMATKLKNLRSEKAKLEEKNEEQMWLIQKQEEVIKEQAPKVEFTDRVLAAESLISTNVIAKDMGMSAVTLNRRLSEMKVIYKQNGVWLLYAKYQNRGLTKTKTHTFTDTKGVEHVTLHMHWTQKGRKFLHEILGLASD